MDEGGWCFPGCIIGAVAGICLCTGPVGWTVGIVLLVIYVLFVMVRNYLINQQSREYQKARAAKRAEQEAEQQRLEKEKQELKARIQYLKEILICIDAVRDNEDFEEAIVVCGNGHVHHYSSFHYVAGTSVRTHTSRRTSYNTQTVSTTTYASPTDAFGFSDFGPGTRYDSSQTIQTPETEYDTDTNSELEWEFGCPTCHSTVFDFKDVSLNQYVACGTQNLNQDNEYIEATDHWYLKTLNGCPLCTEEPVVLCCPNCLFDHSLSVHRLHESFCTQCNTRYDTPFTESDDDSQTDEDEDVED